MDGQTQLFAILPPPQEDNNNVIRCTRMADDNKFDIYVFIKMVSYITECNQLTSSWWFNTKSGNRKETIIQSIIFDRIFTLKDHTIFISIF